MVKKFSLQNWLIVLVTVIMAFAFSACSSDNSGKDSNKQNSGVEDKPEQIVLKVVKGWPEPMEWNRSGEAFLERVQEKLGERIKFDVIGVEAIPTFQQAESVRLGAVDMMLGAANYYSGEMPLIDSFKLFNLPPWELREKGVYDFLDEIHRNELNVHFLGSPFSQPVKFHFYTTEPIDSLDSLKGKNIRISPVYRALVEALGASGTTIAPAEVYTALERGMLDGLAWPAIGIMDMAWDEVIKYRIEPGFYQLDGVAIVNLDSWNKLPADVQQAMTEAIQEIEREWYDHYQDKLETEKVKLKEAGIEFIELSAADAEKLQELAEQAGWNEILKLTPQRGAEIKALLEK